MAGLTPGPEDAEKQDTGAGNLAGSTHSRNTIPANVPARGAEDVVCREVPRILERDQRAGRGVARRAKRYWHDHVQYVPEWRLTATSTLVKAISPGACKTVGSAYPGSNPGPATRKPRSEPVTRKCVTGSDAERERFCRPLVGYAWARSCGPGGVIIARRPGGFFL